jgi:2-oxo-4-hydroxy-4-carboxy-5-ureidoimidazoline decarboxylase
MDTISLEELNTTDELVFLAVLSNIYEHGAWIAERTAGKRPFPTLAALAASMEQVVLGGGEEQQHALIVGHPDLAIKAVRPETLTADSQVEQSSAGLDRLSDEEFSRFHRLNNAYRSKFGVPFIVCVRRHTKDSILNEFERRLRNDQDTERHNALQEIFRIGRLRLARLMRGPDRLNVYGCLSTHVLDTYGGRPAGGVPIELYRISDSGAAQVIARTRTNADGRSDRPLIAEQPIPIGRYELRFALGQYFASGSPALPQPPFLDIVPVQFSIAEPEGHYHVPLLATPWGYTTYRGS